MNDIASPTDSDASSVVDTNTPSLSTTAPKKKGGRPRKEDAAQVSFSNRCCIIFRVNTLHCAQFYRLLLLFICL